jgi:hypothetical protein
MKTKNILIAGSVAIIAYLLFFRKNRKKIPAVDEIIKARMAFLTYVTQKAKLSPPKEDIAIIRKKFESLTDREKIFALDFFERYLSFTKRQDSKSAGKNPYDAPSAQKNADQDYKALEKYFADKYGESFVKSTLKKIEG